MSKRGENIYKRKDNRWEGRYQKSVDVNGRTKLGYVYGKTYREVKEKLQIMKTESFETPKDNITVTFEKVSIEWMHKEKLIIKESTYSKYAKILENHLLPEFSKMEIQRINSFAVNQFVAKKLKNGRLDGKGGLSAKTVQDLVMVLKSILKMAEDEYSCKVQIKNAVLPDRKKRKISVLTVDEQRILSEYAMEDIHDYKRLGLLMCMVTGMRLGEICALRWSDLDLSDGILKIRYTLQRIQNISAKASEKTSVIIDTPKTNSSIREIPLTNSMASILSAVKPREEDSYFLTGRIDKYMEPRTYQYYFSRTIGQLNITPLNFHGLRHTFATRCIENGFDTKSLSEILGHSNVNITLNRYVHTSMDAKKRQMERTCILI
ncbi:tyrosine-type recombinase/integrase [uncultured Robinsoniella sp.]|uniref:tyrosine-type recombinase/integrase n=1 Tax=Robinsoniella sp. TaxID=2496533 RepID=UPI00374E47DF